MHPFEHAFNHVANAMLIGAVGFQNASDVHEAPFVMSRKQFRVAYGERVEDIGHLQPSLNGDGRVLAVKLPFLLVVVGPVAIVGVVDVKDALRPAKRIDQERVVILRA